MPRADLQYWVGFTLIPGVGPVGFSRLLSHFRTLAAAWQASSGELALAGLDRRVVGSIVRQRPKIDLAGEIERLHSQEITAFTWDDEDYPPRLKQIYDPPAVLYVRGPIVPQDEWAVAVVGTRRATPYGQEATAQLAGDLARHGITIVSGLARGIDSVAHRAALDAGGRTIAVFGSGLDVVYPRENARLAQQITEHGALVSEFPLGARPQASNFPRRNRIISGLSLGVLVAEARETGGPHITVRHALEQNREVFAVPGSIFAPGYKGSHRLIQSGAKLVCDVQDILEELNLSMVAKQVEMRELVPADDTESSLLRYLSAEPLHIDEVRRRSGLPMAMVSSTLAIMELKGLVRQVGGMNYVRVREVAVGYWP